MFKRIRNIQHKKRGNNMMCLVCLFCYLVSSASAQDLNEQREQVRDAMHIRFRVSKNIIDPRYMNNEDSLKRIVDWVDEAKRD